MKQILNTRRKNWYDHTSHPPPFSLYLPAPTPPPSLKTEEVSVLEALAASGLRSIRYALEVPAVTRVVANDYSSEAYKNMCRNIGHNSVEGRVVPSCQEARYVAAASCILVSSQFSSILCDFVYINQDCRTKLFLTQSS